ncbi:MAG: hypothetical protein C0510_01255 [Erythrobacter sp.]|nr:hypothetical protein [Erythrobacter sp.]
MKAQSLLLLRIGTGLLLVIWGAIRLASPETGTGVSMKYYSGFAAAEVVQLAWGGILLVVGVLTVLGLFRRFVYPAQAVILVSGAFSIWKYLLDPLGLWLLDRETSQVLFFPSLAVAAATLVLIAFREDDRLAIDRLLGRT